MSTNQQARLIIKRGAAIGSGGKGGDERAHSANAYWWDGAPRVESTAAKVRGGPPFVGSLRVLQSRVIRKVLEPGRAILRAMGFFGYACTEFKRGPRDGRLKLMEVNGRHNLSTALTGSRQLGGGKDLRARVRA